MVRIPPKRTKVERMKREYTNQENFSSGSNDGSSRKAKMWPYEADDAGAGDDELFAVLGYNVKSSDMAEVAQKIQQLEEAMVNVRQDGLRRSNIFFGAEGLSDTDSKLSLPAFGLVSYKFKISEFNESDAYESQKVHSLTGAADDRLRWLQVNHHDFSFFMSNTTPWRR